MGGMSVNISSSGDSTATVVLFGQTIPAEVAAVRRLFAEQRTPYEQQKALWVDLMKQWPDREWGESCLAEAEGVEQLLRRAVVLGVLPPADVDGRTPVPVDSLAERHFVWLGDSTDLRTEHVRDGMEGLARIGMIGAGSQQEALRRGLGLMLNEVERTTAAAWVVWLGPADMLAHLVNSLWDLGVITCAGGRQQKWRTATGFFLRADRTRFDLSLKNSRCTNAAKLDLLEKAFIGPLRFFTGG